MVEFCDDAEKPEHNGMTSPASSQTEVKICRNANNEN